MTNKQLIKRWKKLSLKFKTENTTKLMTEMFLICWGETSIDIDGKKESVVCFDPGGEQGSSGLFCQTDKNNNCIAIGWDSKNNKSIKSKIGIFVETID